MFSLSGVSKKTKCASTILNEYAGPETETQGRVSRGAIVVNNLRKHSEFAAQLKKDCKAKKHAPFFLLSFQFKGPLKVSYFACGKDGKLEEREITGTGFFAHSNSTIDQNWAKVNVGKAAFEKAVSNSLVASAEFSKVKAIRELKQVIFDVLKDETRHNDEVVSKHYEGILPEGCSDDTSMFSSICVKSKCDKFNYGTRTHTVLLVDQKNEVYLIERPSGKKGEKKEEFYRFSCK